MGLIATTRRLAREADALAIGEPVTHVYNPLVYAQAPHELYLRRFGGLGARTVLLGMNPGPFGMAQTGVPFGDVALVRGWMEIEAPVSRPEREHPKRPVEGFRCARSEVSGSRLWGWARERFGRPERFFERFLVLNYCPLCFMERTGRNRTPDKLRATERGALYEICDRALRELIAALGPEHVLGVGKFAQARAQAALDGMGLRFGSILHPSPASPMANRGWADQAEAQLEDLGLL